MTACAHGGHARARHDDAGQVQRIDRGEAHGLARALAAARLAQRLDGVGQRVLLADEARDEAAAARGAARLDAAERPEDLAPRAGRGARAREVAEDDAPAREELLGDRLGERLDVDGAGGAWRRQERPAALGAARARARAARRAPGRGRAARLAQRSRAVKSARTLPKPSAVTSPRETRSQSPSSTSTARRPVTAARSL